MNEPMDRLHDDPVPEALLTFGLATRDYTAQRLDPTEFLARVHDAGKADGRFSRLLTRGSALVEFARSAWSRIRGRNGPRHREQIVSPRSESDAVFNWLVGERSSTVTYLCGPPGTGKTTIIMSLLDRLRADGGESRPILMMSATNSAHYEIIHRTMAEWLVWQDATDHQRRRLVVVDGLDESDDLGGLTRVIHNVSPQSSLVLSCRERVDPVADLPARVVDVRPHLQFDSVRGLKLVWTFFAAQAEAADLLRMCHREGRTNTDAMDRIFARLRIRYEALPSGHVSQSQRHLRFHISRGVCAERYTAGGEDVVRVRADDQLRESILDNNKSMFTAFNVSEPGWVSTRVDRLDGEQLSMMMGLLDPTYQTSAFVGES